MKRNRMFLVVGLIILSFTTVTPLLGNQNTFYPTKQPNDSPQLLMIEDFTSGNAITPNSDILEISVLHAYYYDLDNDGVEDDIYTVVRVYSPYGYVEIINAEIYQYITLPSGICYYINVTVSGYSSGFRLSTYWYNIATESGWYHFKATLDNLNYYSYTYDTAEVVFDPPNPIPVGQPIPDAVVYLS